MTAVSVDQMLDVVKAAVQKARAEKGIVPTPGLKTEGSCFAFPGGEFGNLFWAQLVPTTRDSGEWPTLRFPEILRGVYNYIDSYLN